MGAEGSQKQTNAERQKETDQQEIRDTAGTAGQEHEGQATCGTRVVCLREQPESAAQVQEPGAKRKRTREAARRDGPRREQRDNRPARANLPRDPFQDFPRDAGTRRRPKQSCVRKPVRIRTVNISEVSFDLVESLV